MFTSQTVLCDTSSQRLYFSSPYEALLYYQILLQTLIIVTQQTGTILPEPQGLMLFLNKSLHCLMHPIIVAVQHTTATQIEMEWNNSGFFKKLLFRSKVNFTWYLKFSILNSNIGLNEQLTEAFEIPDLSLYNRAFFKKNII